MTEKPRPDNLSRLDGLRGAAWIVKRASLLAAGAQAARATSPIGSTAASCGRRLTRYAPHHPSDRHRGPWPPTDNIRHPRQGTPRAWTPTAPHCTGSSITDPASPRGESYGAMADDRGVRAPVVSGQVGRPSTLPSTSAARRARPCADGLASAREVGADRPVGGRHRRQLPALGRSWSTKPQRHRKLRSRTSMASEVPRTRRTLFSPTSRYNHAGLRTEAQAWPTALRVFNCRFPGGKACSRQSLTKGRSVDHPTRGPSGRRSVRHVGIQPHSAPCVRSIHFRIKHHPDSVHDLLTGDAQCAHKREDSSPHSWPWRSWPSQGPSPPGPPPETDRPPYRHRLPWRRPSREQRRAFRSRPRP